MDTRSGENFRRLGEELLSIPPIVDAENDIAWDNAARGKKACSSRNHRLEETTRTLCTQANRGRKRDEENVDDADAIVAASRSAYKEWEGRQMRREERERLHTMFPTELRPEQEHFGREKGGFGSVEYN